MSNFFLYILCKKDLTYINVTSDALFPKYCQTQIVNYFILILLIYFKKKLNIDTKIKFKIFFFGKYSLTCLL